MNDRRITEWQQVGRQNLLDAVSMIDRGSIRSAISRAYYSAVASTHAILLVRGYSAPERGNWSNQQLPDTVREAIRAIAPRDSACQTSAKITREELAHTWALRLQADYNPESRLSLEAARDAVKCARRLAQRLETMQ